MPKLIQNKLPAYRRHKASGRAVVTLNGKDFYLGPHGTVASRVAGTTCVAAILLLIILTIHLPSYLKLVEDIAAVEAAFRQQSIGQP